MADIYLMRRVLIALIAAAMLGTLVAADHTDDSGSGTSTGSSSKQIPELNAKVLAFATSKIGEKVGNGECWTLAAEALKDAGAKRADGYTFGHQLDKKTDKILPGDIFQFTSAKFEWKDGRRTFFLTMGSPHHTAVVSKVISATKFEILEQNPGPVKKATIDFKNLKSGEWEVWRPEAR